MTSDGNAEVRGLIPWICYQGSVSWSRELTFGRSDLGNRGPGAAKCGLGAGIGVAGSEQ